MLVSSVYQVRWSSGEGWFAVYYIHHLPTVCHLPSSWHIGTSLSLCLLLTLSIMQILRMFHSLVKQSSKLVSLTISNSQTGSSVQATWINAKWFTIFPSLKVVSTKKVLLCAYIFILVSHSSCSNVYLKKACFLYSHKNEMEKAAFARNFYWWSISFALAP